MSLLISLINQKSFPPIYFRYISTGSVLESHQKGRFMKKIMNETKSSKKKWINSEHSPPSVVHTTPVALSEGATEGRRSANSRRIAVLNKLFMRHITDLMVTGNNNASAFLGRGIEINRVKVTPDFQGVNVFWIAKGTEEDDKLEALLHEQSFNIRHELSQLRVMGNVPRINFIKDKEYAKLMEVDLRLAKADFGEDYVPMQPSYLFRSELKLNTTLADSLKERIEKLDDETKETDDEEPLPPMRMDVLGLNHSEIMAKVIRVMKNSKALHRQNTEGIPTIPTSANFNPVQYSSHRQQKEAFTKFLLKRQILREKAKKENQKNNPEYIYLRQEQEFLDDSQFWEEVKEKDEDYIEDLDDLRK